MSLSNLNQTFAIADHINFTQNSSGLIFAHLNNPQGSAQICLQGGHLTAYQPSGQAPVIWTSQHALFEPGKAIRGGIPICWPWFGPHPSDASKPAHGIARTNPWSVILTEQPSEDESLIQLQLDTSETTQALWPQAFELILSIRMGATLSIELIAKNTGKDSMTLGAALHTYFNISDVSKTHITGLDNTQYIDKFDHSQEKTQAGNVVITAPTDRVYLNTRHACTIVDAGLKRQIQITKAGSQTTVVWNPWAENAAKMGDFGDDEYPTMVCVEAANALDDVIQVAPGSSHILSQTIQVLAL